MRTEFPGTLLCCLCCGIACPALADDEVDELSTTVRAQTDASDTHRKLTVDLEPLHGSGRTLDDILDDLPGVGIRRSGAAGAYATVDLRGLSGNNVAVYLDGVPLQAATLVPVDLGLLNVDSFDELNVYYGTSPSRLTSPLGGTVQLRTRLNGAASTSGHLGYGSFAQGSAALRHTGRSGRLRYSLSGGGRGGRFDFPYYDDRTTPFNEDDDQTRRRARNENQAVFLQGDGELTLDTLRLRAKLRFDGRRQQLPGHGALIRPADADSSDGQLLARIDAEGLTLGRSAQLDVGVDSSIARRQFSDPDQTLNFNLSSSTQSLRQTAIDAESRVALSPSQTITVNGRLQNHLWSSGENRESMVWGSAGTAYSLRPTSGLMLDLSVRGDATNGGTREFSPRFGATLAVSECEFRGSLGRQHRLPSLVERYGDNSTTAPNQDLTAEHARSVESSFSCRRKIAGTYLRAELGAHYAEVRRMIGLLRSSASTFRAHNFSAQTLSGGEASFSWRSRRISLSGSYALVRARNTSAISSLRGTQTPGIPEHRADGQARLSIAATELSYRIDYASSRFLDSANLEAIPARVLHDVGARYQIGDSAALHLTVTNLLDQRRQTLELASGSRSSVGLSDFRGYPLPGRTFFLSLKFWS